MIDITGQIIAADLLLIAAVGLLLFVLMYLWYFHCLFFWHKWDTSRKVTALCRRCGAIRFKH